MPLRLATVRDPQSAEYQKSLALGAADHRAALPLWQAARAFEPDNPVLVGHEALALLDAGRRAEVIASLTDALPRWPRQIHLANLLGVALFELGHAREALALFEHCLTLDAEYAVAAQSAVNARAQLSRARPADPKVRAAIQVAIAEAAKRPKPRLSVCMIVKDEAEFLGGALKSVEGLAHQVVVIDTGSTDGTPELARAAGASVGFFPWTGDFSAARNASLALATGDWILCLDADERVTPSSRSTLRAIMEEPSEGLRVVCPRILNHTRDGRYLSDGFSGRLFPNRSELRFAGRVHEEVGRGLPGIITDYRLDLTLEHFGADPEVMREKAKDERNLLLLKARLEEAPDDLMTWFYLASQHWLGGRRGDARGCFEQVIELFDRNPSHYGVAVRHVPVPYSYVGLVRTLVDEGQPAKALEVGRRGLARFGDNPDLWYHTAYAHLGLNDRASASEFLRRALKIRRTGYDLISMHDPSILAWRAAKFLGDIAFEEGQAEEAVAAYASIWDALPAEGEERVVVAARLVELAAELSQLDVLPEYTLRYLKLRPSQVTVALQVARALGERQGAQAAYDLLTRLYEAVPEVRDQVALPLAIGEIAESEGEDREALAWYERVTELGFAQAGFFVRLAQLLLRLGQHEAAGEAAAVAKRLAGRA